MTIRLRLDRVRLALLTLSGGRSRGGFTSKLHCLADARGRPVAFHLTSGEAADCKAYDTLIALPDRVSGSV